MAKYRLTCSVDAVGIDYEEIIESDSEPSFWDCNEIAEQHGCPWWYCEEIAE